MGKENNLGVALVKELCPACTKEMDGPIVMNKLLTQSMAKKVEELHGKAVGFADHFCEDCQANAEKGIIFIGIDESKTESLSNPYRTGLYAVVKEEAVKRFVDEPMLRKILERRMTYIDHKVAQMLGITPEE